MNISNGSTFPWIRYWLPHNYGDIRSWDEFFPNPQSQFSLAPAETRTLADLEEIQCLVLLGPPGMGKTTELKKEILRLETNGDALIHHIPLGEYSIEDLTGELIPESIRTEWENTSKDLILFLDALDEGRESHENFHDRLGRLLGSLDKSRLKIRITCRAILWPKSFENKLTTIFDNPIEKYDLQPLCREDVEMAADILEIDSEELVGKIYDLKIDPLAALPLTLLMIIKQYPDIPASRTELYRQASLRLLSEINEGRMERRRIGSLGVKAKFAIASRLAALIRFGGYQAIQVNSQNSTRDNVLSLFEATGYSEKYQGEVIEVNESTLTEVIETGLFLPKNTTCQFIHPSFADFLAAVWITEIQSFSFNQAKNLLAHPTSTQRLVPQLRSVVAWSINLNSSWAEQILTISDDALLYSESHSLSPGIKEILFHRIVSEIRDYKRNPTLSADQYKLLNFPGIEESILPLFSSSNDDYRLKRFAISLSYHCNLPGVSGELVSRALDEEEDIYLRIHSVHCLEKLGDKAERAKLKQLISEKQDSRLKIAVLHATYYDVLELKELLLQLAPPEEETISTSYSELMRSKVTKLVTPETLHDWLVWYVDKGSKYVQTFEGRWGCRDLVRKMFEIGFDRLASLEQPTYNSFQEVIKQVLRNHNPDEVYDWLIHERIPELIRAEETRDSVYDILFKALGTEDWWIFHDFMSIATDAIAVKELYFEETIIERRQIFAEIFVMLLDKENEEHIALFWEAFIRDNGGGPLSAIAGHLVLPVVLDSEEASRAKRLYSDRNWQQRQKQEQEERLHQYSLSMLAALAEVEQGDYSKWPLVVEYSLRGTNDYQSSLLIDSLGFTRSEKLEQNRILSAAKTYILEAEPKVQILKNLQSVNRFDLAGFHAFQLLSVHDLQWLMTLPIGIWEKWSKNLVFHMVWFTMSGMDKGEPLSPVRLLFEIHPNAFIKEAVHQISLEDEHKEDYLPSLRNLRNISGGLVDDALFKLLKLKTLKTNSEDTILIELMRSGHDGAIQEIIARLSDGTTYSLHNRSSYAGLLIKHGGDAGAGMVLERLPGHTTFAMRVISKLSWDSHRVEEPFWQRLSTEIIGSIIEWSYNLYPSARKQDNNSDHDIRRLQSDLVHELTNRGTAEAISIMEHLYSQLPNESSWLGPIVEDTRENYFAFTWIPINAGELIDVSRTANNRVVRTSAELISVIVESLGRLEANLHGEPRMARYLREGRTHDAKPLSEEEVSDYIANHLNNDVINTGLIVSREVQIQQAPARQRIDLKVSTISQSEAPINLVIEVKGDWNAEWKTEMKEQLVQDYLGNGIRGNAGLFLVAYFHRTQSNLHRQRGSVESKINEMASVLEDQSKQLSRTDLVVAYHILDCTIPVPR